MNAHPHPLSDHSDDPIVMDVVPTLRKYIKDKWKNLPAVPSLESRVDWANWHGIPPSLVHGWYKELKRRRKITSHALDGYKLNPFLPQFNLVARPPSHSVVVAGSSSASVPMSFASSSLSAPSGSSSSPVSADSSLLHASRDFDFWSPANVPFGPPLLAGATTHGTHGVFGPAAPFFGFPPAAPPAHAHLASGSKNGESTAIPPPAPPHHMETKGKRKLTEFSESPGAKRTKPSASDEVTRTAASDNGETSSGTHVGGVQGWPTQSRHATTDPAMYSLNNYIPTHHAYQTTNANFVPRYFPNDDDARMPYPDTAYAPRAGIPHFNMPYMLMPDRPAPNASAFTNVPSGLGFEGFYHPQQPHPTPELANPGMPAMGPDANLVRARTDRGETLDHPSFDGRNV